MSGIRDKLFLFFYIFRDRTDRPLGKQDQQKQHEAPAQDSDHNRNEQHQECGSYLACRIQKYKKTSPAIRRVRHAIGKMCDLSLCFPVASTSSASLFASSSSTDAIRVTSVRTTVPSSSKNTRKYLVDIAASASIGGSSSFLPSCSCRFSSSGGKEPPLSRSIASVRSVCLADIP